MTYSYACNPCEIRHEVNKPSELENTEELCPKCSAPLTDRRVSFGGEIQFSSFIPGFYHAFGETFTNKRQLDEHIIKQKIKHGTEIVAVGNDFKYMKGLKPKSTPIDLGRAKYELQRAMDKNAR